MAGSLTVLRHRDVALVTSASVVSAVGSGAMFVALPYYTYVLTGSVQATALVTLAEYAPAVGIAQVAGILVDRWDPRRVLIASNFALAAATLAYLGHQTWWWWFAVASFIRSCITQFVAPASHTLIPAIAPPGRLAEVNAVNAIGASVARLAGPALGGVLLGAGGLHTVVIADAASFVAAALLLAASRPTTTDELPLKVGPSDRPRLVQLWREGWSSVQHHPVLRPLVAVISLVGFGEGFVSALLAPWMRDIAGGGSTDLGLMLSLQAVGGIIGGLIVLRLAQRWSSLAMISAGALISGALLVVIINYPVFAPVGPWPAILLTGIAGLPFAVYGTAQAIAVQTHSTDGHRGRIASLTFGVQAIAQLAGIGAAGIAASLTGPLAINAEALAYLLAGALALKTFHRNRHRDRNTMSADASPSDRPGRAPQSGP